VAMKLQRLIDDPNISADQVVLVLSGDPSICAQIIKSANSALFAGKPHVNDVRAAVARLGYRQLRNLVITVAMNNMAFSRNPIINRRMQLFWERSRQVAAICRVVSLRLPQLSGDQAMLAGLMHDIGVLPLCLHIEANHVPIDADVLEDMIVKCSGLISHRLLGKWNFPKEIIDAVSEYQDIHRQSRLASQADYADVITFATLQDGVRSKVVAWDKVAAAKRIGLNEDECRRFLEQNLDAINPIEDMLGLKLKTKVSSSNGAASPVVNKIEPARPATEVKHGFFSFIASLWK
ncbi:MAG: HDOD domain-containing protein, partial [Gallionella sp.]